MNNNKVKTFLSNLLNEEKASSLKKTEDVQKEEGNVNKKYYKEVEKKMIDLESEIEGGDEPVKFNYEGDEKTYHDEIEIRNGQEMIQYDGEPNESFTDRAMKAIEGHSTMGNETKVGKWNPETGEGNGNTEPVWGASKADFGKDLVKTIKSSTKKRDDAERPLTQFGDDIELEDKKTKTVGRTKKVAVEGKNKENIIESFTSGDKVRMTNKNDGNSYMGTYVDTINGNHRFKDEDNNWVTTNDMGSNWELKKINETMKRLRFKKAFGGTENAMKLIPESYRVDDKTFEMTDGNESYKIKWEGNVTEGRAVIISGENTQLVNENIAKMKHLFGYKSSDTTTPVRGNDRIIENVKFNELLGKTKALFDRTKDESEE